MDVVASPEALFAVAAYLWQWGWPAGGFSEFGVLSALDMLVDWLAPPVAIQILQTHASAAFQ